eukprot:COSAG02_NODE_51480_length_313_cov_398.621495_1_plen_44_part_01
MKRRRTLSWVRRTVTRGGHEPAVRREYSCSMLEQAAHSSEDGIV